MASLRADIAVKVSTEGLQFQEPFLGIRLLLFGLIIDFQLHKR